MNYYSYAVLLAFVALLIWEVKSPKYAEQYDASRWIANFSLTFIPVFLSIFISIGEQNDLLSGFLVQWQNYPSIVSGLVCFLMLDVFIYGLHRLSHANTILWRVHCLHHSDPSMDISTNFRHHPLEFLWVLVLLSLYMSIFNVPDQLFALYALVSTVVQLWHHSNVKVVNKAEKILGIFLVTPSMHQFHHSQDFKESNSNFGALFSFWDRLFNTYTDPFLSGDAESVKRFGVEGFSAKEQQNLYAMLIQPFQTRK